MKGGRGSDLHAIRSSGSGSGGSHGRHNRRIGEAMHSFLRVGVCWKGVGVPGGYSSGKMTPVFNFKSYRCMESFGAHVDFWD